MAYKLLLADDSITIQKVVSLTFAEEDFEVICVGNGEIAIEKIGEIRPDVVLADIFMPRKTGYEVCEFVKRTPHLRHIPVILLVGTFEPFDKNESARVGADAHVTKPFETTALIRLVRQAVANAPKPAAAAPPPKPAAPPALEPDKTFQIQLSELDQRLGRTRAPAAPDILDMPPLPQRPSPPADIERTLLTAPVPAGAPLGPDEVLLGPEEELVAPPAPAAPAEEEELFVPELLEVPPLGRRIQRPADEDILGIFELIGLDRLIERQRNLDEAVRREREAAATPRLAAVAEPEPMMVEEEEAVPVGEAAAPPADAVAAAPAAAAELTEDLVTRIARMVIERLSEKAVRDIAWEVVPDLAETIIRTELNRLKGDGK
jgi:CheY-like chemotaxis protein